MFNTPILFLIFNRPDTTIRVFEEIRKIQPKYLFIAADGPRLNKEGDKEKCEEVRKYVLEHIDWACDVKTLFRDQNLGCGLAVSQAISWFFEHVEKGIILEDDCLPTLSFFHFCELMLNRYEDNEQVKIISGTNHLFSEFDAKNGYFFSNLGNIWGWASWRRTWHDYSFTMEGYPAFLQSGLLENKIKNKRIALWLREIMDSVWNTPEELQTWDIQFIYSLLRRDGLGIIPYRNLIQNIGFQGTHTYNIEANHPLLFMSVKDLDVNQLLHPLMIKVDTKTENKTFNNIIKYAFQETFLNKVRAIIPLFLRKTYQQLKQFIQH
ncbi:nucleotide-diphospho-sugar transferase [Cytophagaceae bacterium YF14B1]|uniref:Nucleotide-diphospho-sugar transferase n=1 Tax=Xanthocytophaga flava TaxID=3048013 RepID=A0AAE3QN33_9BACT|nr:nucleotide-diphospho-sugar transferase [Xanthocytophaga flavus]MDJ1482397.1 nucleotide-diphospho-sugar transferase [Xanthocytophaga flavus]